MAKPTKKKPDPQDVINSAGSAASGVPKPIIDAGTKPKPKPTKPPEDDMPAPPEPKISEGTADIGKKKKKQN